MSTKEFRSFLCFQNVREHWLLIMSTKLAGLLPVEKRWPLQKQILQKLKIVNKIVVLFIFQYSSRYHTVNGSLQNVFFFLLIEFIHPKIPGIFVVFLRINFWKIFIFYWALTFQTLIREETTFLILISSILFVWQYQL